MSGAPRLVPPGGTVGVLGSGQLGRMLGLAAREMGYRFQVYSPEADSPAGQVADLEHVAAYDDLDAVRAFAAGVDVVTYEFENVPAATAAACAERAPVHPGPRALEVAQHRLREKRFFRELGLPTPPFAPVRDERALRAALAEIGTPAVLKTARGGYDGKGQVRIDRPEQAAEAWAAIGGREAILEGFVDFASEVSVVAARGAGGLLRDWGVLANEHADHILDVSTWPAPVAEETEEAARAAARAVLEGLDVHGVLCLELFVTADGGILCNEIAPRPHNSGHLTIDASACSQFEQQLRAVCGLPLGDTTRLRPAAMANLLGELWAEGPPPWARILGHPGLRLHLYGKQEARPGRKMGHLTVLADTAECAARGAREARAELLPRGAGDGDGGGDGDGDDAGERS